MAENQGSPRWACCNSNSLMHGLAGCPGPRKVEGDGEVLAECGDAPHRHPLDLPVRAGEVPVVQAFIRGRRRAEDLGASEAHAVRCGLREADPYLGAAALHAYAYREHPRAEGVSYPTDYGTGIEHDAVCSGCGCPWYGDEGGCSDRQALLKAADELLRGVSSSGTGAPQPAPTLVEAVRHLVPRHTTCSGCGDDVWPGEVAIESESDGVVICRVCEVKAASAMSAVAERLRGLAGVRLQGEDHG